MWTSFGVLVEISGCEKPKEGARRKLQKKKILYLQKQQDCL
jgi:hypothetical protein